MQVGYAKRRGYQKSRYLIRCREELLAREEVVPGNAEGGDDLHSLVGDVQDGDAGEHEHVGEAEPDARQDGEDRELAFTAHVVAVLEDVLHAQGIVKRNGYKEGNRGADEVVDTKALGQDDEQQPVDHEGENPHRSELHELLCRSLVERVAHVITPNRRGTPHGTARRFRLLTIVIYQRFVSLGERFY